MTEIVNFKQSDDWTVYIGRKNAYYSLEESIFANPFTLDNFSRHRAVELYRILFYYRVETDTQFREKAKQLEGETLCCWCKPKQCHGDVIVEWVQNDYSLNDIHEIARTVTEEEIRTSLDELGEAVDYILG